MKRNPQITRTLIVITGPVGGGKSTDEEQVVLAHAAEDFEAFGYRRFDCGLPDDAPCALRIR